MFGHIRKLFYLLGSAQALKSECTLAINVVFVQDAAFKLDSDFPTTLGQLVEVIGTRHADSLFGLVAFENEEKGDGRPCPVILSPLIRDINAVMSSYEPIRALSSRRDGAFGSSYDGILYALKDPAIGWNPVEDEGKSEGVIRLIMLLTDALPHRSGDAAAESIGSALTNNSNGSCTLYGYPSETELKAKLREAGAHLAIVTSSTDPNVETAWREINEEVLEQPTNYYQRSLSASSTNVGEGILRAISTVVSTVCKAKNEGENIAVERPDLKDREDDCGDQPCPPAIDLRLMDRRPKYVEFDMEN